MRPDEVLFFKQGDSRAGAVDPAGGGLARFGFHSSFRLPGDPGDALRGEAELRP